ncbi:PAAR motif protein [Streptomyces sp. NRRL F-5755]|uniref:PAAR domain-containing protein n=1 Tax=Streptomyces sp. NRRL F-5755 TaxID=1519475 RepID=UPI0006AFDB11|nr:PAAR domain-containing protein [Streptomyces sp. NRRL F-5755]KOU08792.1 PAAR motif protein [Streptomyces sp. NRRL F-5755]
MGEPAARQDDRIVAADTHIVLVPGPGGPVPTPLPHPFSGPLTGGLSDDVNIGGRPAATVGSTADADPPHMPAPPGTAFQNSPANRGTVRTGSATVHINGKPAARNGDTAATCNDPEDLPVGTVTAVGTVLIG